MGNRGRRIEPYVDGLFQKLWTRFSLDVSAIWDMQSIGTVLTDPRPRHATAHISLDRECPKIAFFNNHFDVTWKNSELVKDQIVEEIEASNVSLASI